MKVLILNEIEAFETFIWPFISPMTDSKELLEMINDLQELRYPYQDLRPSIRG